MTPVPRVTFKNLEAIFLICIFTDKPVLPTLLVVDTEGTVSDQGGFGKVTRRFTKVTRPALQVHDPRYSEK